LTRAASTPGVRCRSRSLSQTQEAQRMPSMATSTSAPSGPAATW